MKISIFSACPELFDGGTGYQDAVRCPADFTAAFNRVKRLGGQGIELAMCDPADFDRKALATAIDETGMTISMLGNYYWCTALGMNMLSPDERVARKSVDMFKQAIEIGAPYGIPAGLGMLRGSAPDGGHGGFGHTLAYYEDKFVEIMKEVADHAEKVKGFFCVEPQTRFSTNMYNNSRQALKLLERIGSDRFKITLDLKQMYVEEDIYQALVACRGVMYNLHFMDADTLAPCHSAGILDFAGIIELLSAIDYDGWIVMPAIVAKQDTERTQDSAIRQSVEYIGGLIERFRK